MKSYPRVFKRIGSAALILAILLSMTVFAPTTVKAAHPASEFANPRDAARTQYIDKSVYMDPTKPIEVRVEALLEQMTLDEKVGQTLQLQRDAIGTNGANVTNYYLGSILSGGGSVPSPNTRAGWTALMDTIQNAAAATPLGIPVLYQIDAVHGTGHMNSNNTGAHTTIFPHNVGAAAIGGGIYDPGSAQFQDAIGLLKRYGHATAEETIAIGIPGTFAPCIPTQANPRWGRTHESWGPDYNYNGAMAAAFVEGFQGGRPVDHTALNTDADHPNQFAYLAKADAGIACMKHYCGEGETVNGANAGNMVIPQLSQYSKAQMKALSPTQLMAMPAVQNLMIPYRALVEAGGRCFMPSFSSINGTLMHEFDAFYKLLKSPVSEGGMGFTGFAVGDWEAHTNGSITVAAGYSGQTGRNITCFNAGLDLCMGVETGELSGTGWYPAIKTGVQNGAITMARLDDANRRILRVKFELGLFDTPNFQKARANVSLQNTIRNAEHLGIAREMVRKSAVLLKNENDIMSTLKDLSGNEILVAGRFAQNIGYQVGSWVASWQGGSSTNYNTYNGRMLVDAIRDAKGSGILYSETAAALTGAANVKAAFVCIGEIPYAEGTGDASVSGTTPRATMNVTQADYAAIQSVKANYPNAKIVLLMMNGRPIILDNVIDDCAAIIECWWFGTEGGGIADLLFDDNYNFSGKTAYGWWWYSEWVGDYTKPWLFPIGYGLKKGEASAPFVRPYRQGSVINISPTAATVIDGRIWTANSSTGVKTYYQGIYGKNGYISSTTIVTPSAATGSGDGTSTFGAAAATSPPTYVEWQVFVGTSGSYRVGFSSSRSGTAVANAVTLLVDGVQRAQFPASASMGTADINLPAGTHILRLSFATTATALTVSSMTITPQGIAGISVGTDVKTLVAGFNANVNVTAGVADGFTVKLQRGATLLGSGTFAGGKAKVALPKEAVTAGAIEVIVCNASGVEVAAAPAITAVAYDADVWKVSLEGQSNSVVAHFNTEIALDADLFNIKLNGVTIPGADTSVIGNDGKSFNIVGVMIGGGGGPFDLVAGASYSFEISGILLPNLFPDYVFTYKTVFKP